MLENKSEYNHVGNGGYGYGSNCGGVPAFGLFGAISGRDNHRKDDDCDKALFTLNAIGNLKDTIAEAKDSLADRLDSSKDALTSRIESTKDKVTDEARHIDEKLCEVRADVKDGAYALAMSIERNANDIKSQAQAFQIANDRKFDDLSREGERNTALILAKLNQTELDGLRDQLHGERRRSDSREIEINIQNSNAQAQAQVQAQNFEFNRKFDALFTQVAKSSQDIINVGGILAGVSQTANPVNVK